MGLAMDISLIGDGAHEMAKAKQYKDEIDYSLFKEGDRVDGGVIEICPECGRKGKRVLCQIAKGRWQLHITHKLKVGFMGIHGPWECVDSCLTTIVKAGNEPVAKG